MKKIFFLIILISVLIFGFTIWWKQALLPVDSKDISTRIFVVRKGQGVRETANSLKKERLIKDPVAFFLLIKKLGLDNKIQAGDFRLSPSMSSNDIAENLTHGTVDIWITIPEGLRSDEIADILKTKMEGYNDSWRISLRKKEGYLFPDTYLIPKDADIDQIITLLTNNFENKFSSLNQNNLSKEKIVTIASMVEREAKYSSDRSLVASVIFNRLRIGMALQIDATIQYALGYQFYEKTWWKRNLTLEDIKMDSPYNTYQNTGLPPTPISNPGYDVLDAVVNAKKTNYLYYLSDKSGKNHYSETLEGHNYNIKKFL